MNSYKFSLKLTGLSTPFVIPPNARKMVGFANPTIAVSFMSIETSNATGEVMNVALQGVNSEYDLELSQYRNNIIYQTLSSNTISSERNVINDDSFGFSLATAQDLVSNNLFIELQDEDCNSFSTKGNFVSGYIQFIVYDKASI